MSDPLASELVPRETAAVLKEFLELLSRWNQKINLISRKESSNLWQRHILDSAQLLPLAPSTATRWLDIGAGGGFPGLVCAIIARDQQRPINFTLVESDLRKTAFLREATIRFDLPVTILGKRIEDVSLLPQDVISARALAPLEKLLSYSSQFSHPGTTLVFPKGRQWEMELTEARKFWHMNVNHIPSRTDAEGSILRISEVSRRA